MLTAEQQGMLVCDALNRLPHPDDLAEQNEFAELCCPDCCPPCGLLRDLLDDGTLDDIVRGAPSFQWQGQSWWATDGVNTDWLRACWECVNRPKCDTRERP